MTLNPVPRVDTQMIEAITAHERVPQRAARRAREAPAAVASRRPTSGSSPIRISSPAACASSHRHRAAAPAAAADDEPTTALDVTIQSQILAEVQDSARNPAPR